MSRTLVTGAAGFTGRYVSGLLADRGHEVHGLVHVLEPGPVTDVHHVHEADLADFQSLERIVGEICPDYVIHLAAIPFVAHGNVEEMYRTNVVGTRHLLEALSRAEAPPSSLILASSANIYGNAMEGELAETAPPAPVNDYGVSKLAMEYVARLYTSRLPIIVVRPFNYTGRGQSESFILPKIVAHAKAKAPLIRLGNLDVSRDFSDVRNVAEAYVRLLSASEAVGETFNICSGRAVSLRTVLDTVGRLSGHTLKVKVDPDLVRANEVRSLCGSSAKLERVVGVSNTIALEETLGWMLEDRVR